MLPTAVGLDLQKSAKHSVASTPGVATHNQCAELRHLRVRLDMTRVLCRRAQRCSSYELLDLARIMNITRHLWRHATPVRARQKASLKA